MIEADFMTKCMQWLRVHVVFEHGSWWVVDNGGEKLDGPYCELHDDDLERMSLEYAVEYAEDWWDDLNDDEEFEERMV